MRRGREERRGKIVKNPSGCWSMECQQLPEGDRYELDISSERSMTVDLLQCQYLQRSTGLPKWTPSHGIQILFQSSQIPKKKKGSPTRVCFFTPSSVMTPQTSPPLVLKGETIASLPTPFHFHAGGAWGFSPKESRHRNPFD
jgi:hypothetical protein